MTGRRVVGLLAAGVAVIAFAMWIASQRHLERATLSGDLVLPSLEHSVNTVTEVTLRKGDGTHATLEKDAAGWSVGERHWPADTSRVRKLLLDLGALNVVEEKTRVPANYPQLGVEDVSSPKATGTRVEVVSPGHTWSLIVGKSSSAKSGFVRVVSAPQSLLAAPLLTVDADPKGWLERTLIDLPANRVREVEEKPAGAASYTVAREKKEQTNFSVTPLPKGRELSYAGAADPIASALSSLNFDDVSRVAASPDPKAAHALYHTFDGLEVEVAGRKDGTRSLMTVSARSSAKETEAEAQKLNARLEGWEFELPDYKYSAIFRPLEDLLKKPPEPEKKAAKKAARTPTPPKPGASAKANK
ncbi:MAG TPA: DUF4340 domain-containing protein [Steroidobacteraceae bacterium]|nr:DUF4340 domain-containing protein [Steroidobacteraceae bacterium]